MIGIIGGDINGLLAAKFLRDDCIVLEKDLKGSDISRPSMLADYSSIEKIISNDGMKYRLGIVPKVSRVKFIKDKEITDERPSGFDDAFNAKVSNSETYEDDGGDVPEVLVKNVLIDQNIVLNKCRVIDISSSGNSVQVTVSKEISNGFMERKFIFEKVVSTIPFWALCDACGISIPTEVKFKHLVIVSMKCNSYHLGPFDILRNCDEDAKWFKMFNEGNMCRVFSLVDDDDLTDQIRVTIGLQAQMALKDHFSDVMNSSISVKHKYIVVEGQQCVDDIITDLKKKGIYVFGNSASCKKERLSKRMENLAKKGIKVL